MSLQPHWQTRAFDRMLVMQGLDQLGAFFEQQQQNAPDVLDAERGFELPIGEVRVSVFVDSQ